MTREKALEVFRIAHPLLARLIKDQRFNHPRWDEAYEKWEPFFEGFEAGWKAKEREE